MSRLLLVLPRRIVACLLAGSLWTLLDASVVCAEPSLPSAGSVAASAPAPLDPADRERWRALIKQAGERLQAGDQQGAVGLLEQARAMRADPSIDYNLGVAYSESGRPAYAAEAYERFLATADPARVLPERIAEVRRKMAEYTKTLARITAHIRVSTQEPVLLYLNERLVATLRTGDLNEPRWVVPGSYRVRAAATGRRDHSITIELSPGEERALSATLEPEGTTPSILAAAQPKAVDGPKPFYKKPWFWATVGGGAVVIIGLSAAAGAGAFDRKAPGMVLDPVDLF